MAKACCLRIPPVPVSLVDFNNSDRAPDLELLGQNCRSFDDRGDRLPLSSRSAFQACYAKVCRFLLPGTIPSGADGGVFVR